MTKKTFASAFRVILPLILLCLLLTGCQCIIHKWQTADCDTPKTCSRCQATEGDSLGHTWVDASCEAPKTCSVCNVTEGKPLSHIWSEATCQAAKVCAVCNKTDGVLGDHKWQDATTELPKTCSVCQVTEGERIITDARFKTANCKDLFGTWVSELEIPGNQFVDENFTGVLYLNYTIIFNQDGTYREVLKMLNKEQFNQSVIQYYIETLYAEFSAQGYNKEQADKSMVSAFGMNVEDYSKKLASAFNWDALFSADVDGVYFIADDKLHSGKSWDDTLTVDSYTLTDDTLAIETIQKQFTDIVFYRS